MLQTLIKICIQQRLAAIVLTLIVAAFGVYSYLRTPIEAYPDVTNVQVEVVAQVAGLAPEEMERQVTIPLERALNGNPGMIQMRSESAFGLTIIWCVFEDGYDSFRARTQTAERLLTAEVPEEAFVRLTPDATPLGKIFYYKLTSDRHDLYQLRSEQEWTVARMLKQVPGVADALGMGGFLKEVHVEVDPPKLAAYGLTLAEVSEAIERSNLNVGGGIQKRGDQQFLIRAIGYLMSPQDIKDVVLEVESGTPVTIGDVARVVQSYTPRYGAVGYDDEREIVDVMERILTEQTNYEVKTALSGFQAGMECERFKPHVILLDIHIGEADSKQLADMVRKNEHLQFTKIVAMSGKLTDGQANGLRGLGYDGFLKKPFQLRQVVEAIEAATNLVA